MAYKQNPKSPILKALVGNQHKLPQHLQDAIKAAPESPAKKKGPTPAEKKKAAQKSRFENKMKTIESANPAGKYPKSPAKKSSPGDKKKNIRKGTINAARQMLKDSTGINNPNLSDAEVIRAAKTKGIYQEASSQAKRAAAGGDTKYGYSPAKKYKK